MDWRVPDPGSWGVCRAESAAAGEEAADHPLPQPQEPRDQPEAAGAAAAAVCVAAQQEGTRHHGQSLCSQWEEKL